MTDSKVVPIRKSKDLAAAVEQACAQLVAAKSDVKRMLIIAEVGDEVLAWVGPNPESVSYLSDFAKSLIVEQFRLQFESDD